MTNHIAADQHVRRQERSGPLIRRVTLYRVFMGFSSASARFLPELHRCEHAAMGIHTRSDGGRWL